MTVAKNFCARVELPIGNWYGTRPGTAGGRPAGGIIFRSEVELNRLKELRVDRDLTQRQVATAIGITQRKYSYIETGVQQITEALLKNLAEYYGVSVDYLLNLTDDPTPYPKKKRRA